jgi:hypothetical protein
MAVLNPEHLLDQANRLATPLAGGAPRQADLRRAISTAYYAVFHGILIAAADDFIGRSLRTSERYALLYRSVDHRALRALCEDIPKATLPAKYAPYSPSGGFDPDIVALASAVADLQERRHAADYDPRLAVSASDAALAVSTARVALARLNSASRTSRKAFLTLVVFSPRSK